MNEEQKQIIVTAMNEFAQKGLKFTMQDVAESIHMAKKTIYSFYPSKEDLMIGVLDYGFAEIHERKRKILESDLSDTEKIRQVMIAMPDQYDVFDFRQFSELRQKYPRAYSRLRFHLESDWDPVIQLLETAQKKGEVRNISLTILRMIMTAGFETFLSSNVLAAEGIPYQKALQEMMDIVMNGIVEDDHENH